jgi:hypothetical protein
MEAMNAAMTNLYKALTPDQQKLLDSGVAYGGPGMMGRGGRGL